MRQRQHKRVEISPKLLPVFAGEARYRCAYGGRGSGKSYSFALMLALRGAQSPLRILCARELQNSIKDSVHAEVVNAIQDHPWLAEHYEWGESFIRGRYQKTEFIFKGLRTNYREIKSMSRINICWIEEAESVSKASWDILVPTIREPGSEIWITWNPESIDSPVQQRFVVDPPADTKIAKVNWRDNPWFPEVLEQERLDCLANDPDSYYHTWEGECITRTDAQILNGKWSVREFEPDKSWGDPYHGADWGYASDPTAAIRCWIHDDRLWIEHESYQHRLELNDVAVKWRRDIPGIERYVLRADSAQPAMISHVKRELPRIIGAPKWKGSIEDGIAYLRSFREIVIHPRCVHFADEARRYSYKVDRRSGDVLPVIVDAHNHLIDSLRYACTTMILAKSGKQSSPLANTDRSAANTRERVGGIKRQGRVFG